MNFMEEFVLYHADIAQLARASALKTEGHRFDSDSPHENNGSVVQLVRTLPCKVEVIGSSPIRPAKWQSFLIASSMKFIRSPVETEC